MYIVAGAPGSGKSRTFPVSGFGVDFFNADDRAAQLNGGYHDIPLETREQVNREFEAFIRDHIRDGASFALETTLRSTITFEQIAAADRNAFDIVMFYLGIEDVEVNLKRIRARSALGFHSAPTDVLLAIHQKSLVNLREAVRQATKGQLRLFVFDNTSFDQPAVPLLEIDRGSLRILREPLPRWARLAMDEALQ